MDAALVQIAAGCDHSLALDSNGNMWAWGVNSFGQLGDGTLVDSHAPVRVGSDVTFTRILAMATRSVAVDSDGRVWAWGADEWRNRGFGVDSRMPVVVAG